jgi:hypothetical protein
MNTMNLAVEPLETLEAPYDWWSFGAGLAVGVGIGVGIVLT